MKLLPKMIPMLLVVLGLFFIVGCEDTSDDDDVVNPLVGTWAFSNMEQTSVYTAVDDTTLAPFYMTGDTVGSGSLVWAQFEAMGVNGSLTILADGSFTLSGSFPLANDTLGMAPTITPLTDAGTWTEDTDAGTLVIDGAFYDLGGMVSWSDDENTVSMVYAASEVGEFVLPVNMGGTVMYFPGTMLNEYSMTTLGFTRQ